MNSSLNPEVPGALVISGDARINRLLAQPGAIVQPAFACRLDGFVNDTFTEYANPSVYRPASVCEARLVSTLSENIHYAKGRYYLGFTVYTASGHEEPCEIWIGHRQVARAFLTDPDNRLHLFVVPRAFRFAGGEPVRLVTERTGGPYRIENLVLLPRRPGASRSVLEIRAVHADLRREGGQVRAYVTWTTNRPAIGQLRWETGKKCANVVSLPQPLVNHEAVLEGLSEGETYQYEIRMADRTGGLTATCPGTFRVGLLLPESRVQKARVRLKARRAVPGGPGLWPVSTGVPFPEGALGNTGQVRLLCGGEEVPVQVQTLASWPDGSVKWALLDFQGDGRSDLGLEYGRRVSRGVPEDAIRVEESGAGILVTTSVLRVRFPTDRTVLPGVVSLRRADGSFIELALAEQSPAAVVVGQDGTRFVAGKPDAIVVEERGSERVCVRIEVDHRQGKTMLFRSIFRVHLFRNSARVRVLHTFENDRVEEEFTHIREFSLRMDLDPGARPIGRVCGQRVEFDTNEAVCLTQTHDNRYVLEHGGKTLKKGRRATGMVDLWGERAGVSVGVRDFWQTYPKGLRVDRGGVTVQVCPPLADQVYPTGVEIEERLYYYLLNGRYKFKRGVSHTQDIWFEFREGGGRPAGGTDPRVQDPPLYSVSLVAFNKSRAVTQLPSKTRSPYAPFETWMEGAHHAYADSRELSRAYGMLNYGDDGVYWSNVEYDTPWCFLQEYIRGGHPDFYVWGDQAARHQADVDTCHHHPDSGFVGAQYAHCVGHVGGYYPDGYRGGAIFSGRWTISHTWVEGLFFHHLLSGDRRSLESALKTSGQLAGSVLNDYDFTNCRNSGWHLIHLSAAYQATGRRVFLNAARLIVDRVLERQRPSGGWERLMVPGHCFCRPPRHTGNAGFMVGILMVGLKRYFEATGDRRAARAIVRAADYSIQTFWIPEKKSTRYTSCPHSSIRSVPDAGFLKGVATAYRISGQERFREVLAAGLPLAVSNPPTPSPMGTCPGLTYGMRGIPQILAALPELGNGKDSPVGAERPG